jgi:hypothetical protein
MPEATITAPEGGICTETAQDRRAATVAKRLATCSPMFRPVLEKAYSGDASPKKAIKAMCLECVGYDRESIRSCTGYSCPLWLYRPYQTEGV